jgi:DUF1680 family protein
MIGPVSPSSGALAPVADVRLDPAGLFGSWQARNAAATIPHCVAGVATNVANVKRVAHPQGTFEGMWFADSDVYKTLEAVAWAGGDEEFLDTTAELLAKAQDADGYLNSYFQTDHRDRQWAELRWSHELYCAGHLIQAAVAAARTGRSPALVEVARRFADLLVERFSAIDAVDGHPEVETALVELYRVTGHEPYLTLAKRFVDLRGHGLLGEDRHMGSRYYQDHVPVREADEVTGHAVRQLYLLAGMVDVAVETGDDALLQAAERLWESAFHTKTYLTGAHGSRHRDEAFGDPYELPPDRAYGETCAAIASFQWNYRMLLATGRAKYADEMERVLYNGIAVATSEDGRHFFYSNPLQLRTGHDGSNEDAPSGRLSWYRCPCCPPNLARLMASLHSYVATSSPDGVQLHLYTPGTIHSGHGPIEVSTGYPWNGVVRVTVSQAGRWTLSLRVPGWCTSAVLEGAVLGDGYLHLTRDWTAGETVTLELGMDPRYVTAHPHVDAVRGCVALARGPIVYCLEQTDHPGTVLEDIRLDPDLPVAAGDGVTLRTTGRAETPASSELYGSATPDSRGGEVAVTAVPYFTWGNRGGGAMRVWVPAVERAAERP